MKTLLPPLLLIAGLSAAHADDTAPAAAASAEQARATWQAMSPEQQAAAKAMARSQAEEKTAAWGALSAEEKAAKQAAAKDRLQPVREDMQARVQARMAGRPFGRR